MFCTKQANTHKLPPTRTALNQSILRAYHQAIVWNNDIEPNPNISSPCNYGWKMESDHRVLIMTSVDPAPLSVLKVTQSSCVKSHFDSARYSCRQGGVNCTDLCGCYNNEESCSNMDHDIKISLTKNQTVMKRFQIFCATVVIREHEMHMRTPYRNVSRFRDICTFVNFDISNSPLCMEVWLIQWPAIVKYIIDL